MYTIEIIVAIWTIFLNAFIVFGKMNGVGWLFKLLAKTFALAALIFSFYKLYLLLI